MWSMWRRTPKRRDWPAAYAGYSYTIYYDPALAFAVEPRPLG